MNGPNGLLAQYPAAERGGATAAEAQLRYAVEAGRIGIWQLDLQTLKLTASALFNEHVGADPRGTLSWEDVSLAVHPDDQELWRAALARSLSAGCDYEAEVRVRRGAGGYGWVHLRGRYQAGTDGAGTDGAAAQLSGVAFDVTEQHDIARRLEVKRELLRLAAELAGVGTWDYELATDRVTLSDHTAAIFGVSPSESHRMSDILALMHPEDRETRAAALAAAIDPAQRASYHAVYRVLGSGDGAIRWVESNGKGLFSGDVCRRVVGTLMDVTVRNRTSMRDAFLLSLLDQLRQLTDPDAIMDAAVSALGRHLGASRVGYGRVQPDDASIVLKTCYADGVAALSGAFPLNGFGAHYIHRQRRGLTVAVDDVACDPDAVATAWAAIDTRAFLSMPLVRDGRLRASLFVNYRTPHVWDPQEVALVEEVAARIWDALERAHAEDNLRQLNALLERQVEVRGRELDRMWRLSPVLMVVGGPDGTLQAANPAWTKLLGWTPEETIGHDVMEFVAAEDRAVGAAGMALLFQGQPVIDYQISFIAKGGEQRRIAWTTVPEGGLLHGFGRDITEQVAAEEKLRQAQKMEAVGQLTGGLAHDFNNLLTGITGSLELLQTRLKQRRLAEADRYIEAAQGAARRAAALTQRLLAFSRRQTLDPRPTDVNRLVAGLEDLVRRTVGPALEVEFTPADGLWTALVDPHQLENALLNLCINARDAMPNGGRLSIQTANHDFTAAEARERDLTPGQYLSLIVTDTGTGMTAEVMRRAFDPFFTTKPLGAGTGLGLSMVYGFARQSGGQVRIASEPGRGTKVCLILPRHAGEADTAAASEPGAAARSGMGETVLVVDDEATVRMLVCEVLEDLGYHALEAEDGAAGLKLLDSAKRVDLLVTDVGLPGGLNGRQLADAARTLRPGLRVLFITGYAESVVMGGGTLDAGMQVMTKPFGLDALAARIREMIGEQG